MKVSRPLYVVMFFLYSLLACHRQSKQGRNPCILDDSVSRIVILNKTTNKFIATQILIDKPDEIKDINKKLVDLSPSDARDAKNNFGFYQVIIEYKNAKTDGFSVIYSVYNGVLIGCSNGFYKDNGLESLILSKFQ